MSRVAFFICKMGSSKTTTTTNTYGHQMMPTTPEMTRTQEIADKLRDKINPMIRGNFAAARRNLKDSFTNPLGAHTTAAIRDATIRSGNQELDQQENLALSNAEFQANQADWERSMGMAQLTKPQLVQTGGTQTQSGGFLGDLALGLVGGAAQAGSAYLG